MKEGKICQ